MWADAPLSQIEVRGRLLTGASPLTGKVVAVNGELQDRPELALKAPYGDGWVCVFQPTRLAEQEPEVRWGEKAAAWFEQEVQRFSQFLWTRFASDLALGETGLDGGVPAPGSLPEFDADPWKAFELEFLRPRQGIAEERGMPSALSAGYPATLVPRRRIFRHPSIEHTFGQMVFHLDTPRPQRFLNASEKMATRSTLLLN
jgi:hypothetical protein